MTLEERKTHLLSYLLPLVAHAGWTDDVLRQACRQADESFAELFSLTAKPLDDIVAHYSYYLDAEMLEACRQEGFHTSRIREKATALVMARLKAADAFKDAAYNSLVYLAMPQNFLLAQRLKYRTLNQLWYAAGDTATDYNYYTKRALLAGVYSLTWVYWFKDANPDSSATLCFLQSRIDNIMQIRPFKATASRIFSLFNAKKPV